MFNSVEKWPPGSATQTIRCIEAHRHIRIRYLSEADFLAPSKEKFKNGMGTVRYYYYGLDSKISVKILNITLQFII